MKRLLVLLLLLCVVNISYAATTRTWDNGNSNQLWTDTVNWSQNLTPTIADIASIRLNGLSQGAIINNPMAATAFQILIGGDDPNAAAAYVSMNGGTLDVGEWLMVGYNLLTRGTGIFNMNGGTVTTGVTTALNGQMWVGSKLAGTASTLNMTNGSINVSDILGISEYSGVAGIMNLSGGTITAAGFRMNYAGGTAGKLDITGTGKLIITGNIDSTIATYITNTWITASAGGTIQHDYNITNPGKTTVWVPSDPTKAASPNPANNAAGVMPNTQLSWTAGSGTPSHNVYFGTTSPGTFQGNQTGTSFNPGSLVFNTAYYWRIDEVSGPNTVTGDVWSFTVTEGKAMNPDPANSATNVALDKMLGWTPGFTGAAHDVYFGTSQSDVTNASLLLGDLNRNACVDWNDVAILAQYWLEDPTGSEPYAGVNSDTNVDFVDYAMQAQNWMSCIGLVFKGNQAGNSYTPVLAGDTTYYWRIDEVRGSQVVKGNIWSFSTSFTKATSPTPANGASNVFTNAIIVWTAGAGATSHDVYFGTTNPPPSIGNQTATTYNPGTLAYSTTYYWRIDEVNGPNTVTGDLWSFTTVASGPEFTFVQASDPQMGWTECGNMDYLWGTTIGKINIINPAFVIVTGDLITSSSNMTQTATYKSYAAGINPGIPIYTVPGNHDIGDPSSSTKYAWWASNLAYPTGLTNPWYSFTYGDSIFIGLDSGVFKADWGGKQAAEIAWLTTTLQDATAAGYTHKFVFMHVALFVASAGEAYNAAGNLPLAIRGQLLSLFHQYGVKVVMAGHRHTNNDAVDGDLQMFTTTSCTCGLGVPKTTPGIRIFKVYSDHVEQEVRTLDSIN
jgi:hypothetical protein